MHLISLYVSTEIPNIIVAQRIQIREDHKTENTDYEDHCMLGGPPEKLIRFGLKGWPLKGEPSAFHACFKAYCCTSSSVVGNPCCFLCCSYMIFRIAP